MNLNCVICAELLKPTEEVYATTCGHIFHYICLIQWLQRSKTCPQCRQKCLDRNFHRIYFNLANLDASRVDAASRQEQLDNAELQIKLKESELQKASKEVEDLKDIQKKTMKTITGLEKKVEQKNILILSFNEQMNILKNKIKQIDEIKQENKKLKAHLDQLESLDALLAATSPEVDKMLLEKNSITTLTVWVAALKRELRTCESRKIDLRKTLKVVNDERRKEHELRKELEEKVDSLERSNHKLLEKIKSLEHLKENFESMKSVRTSQPRESSSGQTQAKKIKLVDSTNNSPQSLLSQVKKIEEADSPYFNIKQSVVGLAPIIKFPSTSNKTDEGRTTTAATKKMPNDLSVTYTIFKKPRQIMQVPNLHSTNIGFNGVGGSERKDESHFPDPKQINRPEKVKSINNRLKSGQLRRMTTGNTETIKKYLEKN